MFSYIPPADFTLPKENFPNPLIFFEIYASFTSTPFAAEVVELLAESSVTVSAKSGWNAKPHPSPVSTLIEKRSLLISAPNPS